MFLSPLFRISFAVLFVKSNHMLQKRSRIYEDVFSFTFLVHFCRVLRQKVVRLLGLKFAQNASYD